MIQVPVKPAALYQLPTGEILSLLKGGKSVPRNVLVEICKYALAMEVLHRDLEITTQGGGIATLEDAKDEIKSLEEVVEEMKKECDQVYVSLAERENELDEKSKELEKLGGPITL